jgi:hypothetical protein
VTEYLPEVPEVLARGSVAATYAEIRAVVGLPIVNLVYRSLATVPGRLEAVWAELAPVLREPAAHMIIGEIASSAKADGVVKIPRVSLAACGVEAATLDAVELTLDAYERGNATNLIALAALRAGVERPPAPAMARAPVNASEPGKPLPVMAELQQMSSGSRMLVEEMSAAVTGGKRPILVPSLFRHLTQPAALLALVWTALRRPLSTPEFEAQARGLSAAAGVAIQRLPFGVARVHDDDARAVLDRFSEVIPRMLVLGAMVRAALSEGFASREADKRAQRHV